MSGVIIPELKDIKVKLTYISPEGTEIVRYAKTSGGGRFTDFFQPKSVGRWEVIASYEVENLTKEVESEAIEFTVERNALAFYGLLASLISLIILALYVSFVFFI